MWQRQANRRSAVTGESSPGRLPSGRTEPGAFSRGRRSARRRGLTPERYDLLLMIQAGVEGGVPLRVTDLSESLQLRQTAVTENVKRAVAAGLIERRPSPHDGRASLLFLTHRASGVCGPQTDMRGDRAALDGRSPISTSPSGPRAAKEQLRAPHQIHSPRVGLEEVPTVGPGSAASATLTTRRSG